MAEDTYSRTEPPSERRLAQARAEGRVPRSAALSSLLVLGAALIMLLVWGARLFKRLQDLLATHFTHVAQSAPESALFLLQQMALEILPFLAALFVAALFAPMLLSGWVFSLRAARFEPGRLNPLSRLLRLFSADGMFDALRATLIWLAALGLLAWFFRTQLDELTQLSMSPLGTGLPLAGHMLLQGLSILFGAVLLAALLDAPWQWWRHLQGLAMTRAEVEAEAREGEGNPELRARMRRRPLQKAKPE